MSAANFMNMLLDGAEVGWTPLSDVVHLRAGQHVSASKIMPTPDSEYPFPCFGGNGIRGFVAKNSHDGKYLLIGRQGALCGNVKRKHGKFYATEHAVVVTASERINIDWAFHLLALMNLNQYASQSAQPGLAVGKIESLKVPIPCPGNPQKSLEIQAKIAYILDSFIGMALELTAELTARKLQYNYYRDQLLSFKEGGVEWQTLGNVTKKWYSGGTPTAGNPDYYDGGDIPWLRTQEVKFADINGTAVKITQKALEKSAAKWIPANCVIVAISGATAGRSAINKIPLTTNQHCGCLEIDSTKALYRYVFHWVSFNYETIKALGQGPRGDLNSSIIKGFSFPLPFPNDPKKSLAEQARIVAILDKFDALTNSRSDGLPREIELRQKQYEYYREHLFNFSNPQEVEA